jgi:hypothetical protein
LGTQLHSIGEALDLPKRIELMEGQDPFHRDMNDTPEQYTSNNHNRQGPPRNNYERKRVQGQVATCGGTTLGKIITTPGVRKSLITTGHGARGAGMCHRAHKEEKVRGVDIETAIRKTKCRSR